MTNQQALVLINILKSVISELQYDYPLRMEYEQLKALQESLQPSINSVANFPKKGENG